jgi:hypothetical protein
MMSRGLDASETAGDSLYVVSNFEALLLDAVAMNASSGECGPSNPQSNQIDGWRIQCDGWVFKLQSKFDPMDWHR